MTRKTYASRHLGRLSAVLASRPRSYDHLYRPSSGVPRWWTDKGWDLPWRIGRHLSAAGLRLQSARALRLWSMAGGVAPLPPMLPEPVRPVPPSWMADR